MATSAARSSAAELLPQPATRLRSRPKTPHLPKAPGPFLKWAGGKSKLLQQLVPLMPPGVELMRHVEPFLGGGAMFFARRPERAYLADVNKPLMGTYRAIRDDLTRVMERLHVLERNHSKETYYQVRSRYNRSRMPRAERAALFIYLNKTCFNGLHRVNRKGEFNVPAGSYKNPRILDEATLHAAHHTLQDVELACQSFETLVEQSRPGDFVYFDPPYEPVSRTANFTSYAEGGFSQQDQTRLRDVFQALSRRGCKLMLSNSDTPFIRALYRDHRQHTVSARRAINRDAKRRGPVRELVVTNY